jgi:hypothetical protein
MRARVIARAEQLVHDMLNGRVLVDETTLARRPWVKRVVRAAGRTARIVRRWVYGKEQQLPGEDGDPPPWSAGKPAPLVPRPDHHLVAARALPPKDSVYLLPKD